jgi:hypothetical protein
MAIAEAHLMMATTMTNAKVALCALLFLGVCSCAATPAKPNAPQPVPKHEATPAASAPEEERPAIATAPSEPRRKLGPGQCDDCFDCVDTVGFPPSGQKWACVNGKCVKAKLPGFSGENKPAETGTAPEPEPSQVSSRKAKKRRRR